MPASGGQQEAANGRRRPLVGQYSDNMGVTTSSRLSTTGRLLVSPYCCQPSTGRLLLAACNWPPTTGRLLLAAPLRAAKYFLPSAGRLLLATFYWPPTAGSLLLAAYDWPASHWRSTTDRRVFDNGPPALGRLLLAPYCWSSSPFFLGGPESEQGPRSDSFPVNCLSQRRRRRPPKCKGWVDAVESERTMGPASAVDVVAGDSSSRLVADRRAMRCGARRAFARRAPAGCRPLGGATP